MKTTEVNDSINNITLMVTFRSITDILPNWAKSMSAVNACAFPE